MVIYIRLPNLTNIKTMRKSKFILAVLAAVAAHAANGADERWITSGEIKYQYDYSYSGEYTNTDLQLKDVTVNLTTDTGTATSDTERWVGAVGMNRTEREVWNSIVNMDGGALDMISPDANGYGAVYGSRTINVYGTAKANYVTAGLMGHGRGLGGYGYVRDADGKIVTDAGGQKQVSSTPYKSKENVTVNVYGNAVVGQIRGGTNANGWSLSEVGKYAIGGDVIINVYENANILGLDEGVEDDAIRGAGGSRCSVEGSVIINISDNAVIGNNIYAGARKSASNGGAYVGGDTRISISGNSLVKGNVYAGGSEKGSEFATVVKGDTYIEISGGTVEKDIYGAGNEDIVNGGTNIVLSGGEVKGDVYAGGKASAIGKDTHVSLLGNGTKVAGVIHGGSAAVGSETGSVNGSQIMDFGDDDTSYSGTARLADFTDINVNNGAVKLESLETSAKGTNVDVAEKAALTVKSGVLEGLNELNVDGTLNVDMNGADATKDAVSGKVLTMGDNAVINVMLDGAEAANSIALFGFDDTPDDAGEITITLNGKKVDSSLWSFTDGNLVIQEATTATLNLSRNQSRFYNAARAAAAADPDNLALIELTTARDEAAVKAGIDAMSGHEYATAMSSQIEGNLGHLRRLHGAMGKGEMLGKVTDAKMGTTTVSPWRAGVSVFHEETEIDSDARGDGYDRSETGAMLNVEYLTRKDVTLGGAISYGRTNLRTDGAARRHEDNTRFDVYALYGQKRWSFATSLGLGMHEHELLGGDVDGYSINFLQDAAYTVLSNEKSNVQVFGTVESSWNDIDGCSDGVVSAGSQDAWATDVTAGVRYNRALRAFGNAPAGVFTAQTGVTASIGDIKSGVDMNLGGYGYRQESATRNRWGWNLGAGVDVPVRTNVSVYGTAEAVLRGDSNSVDGQIGVKVSF